MVLDKGLPEEIDGSKWETLNFSDDAANDNGWDQLSSNLDISELNCISTKGDVLEVANVLKSMGGKVNAIFSHASDLISPQEAKLKELNDIYARIRLRAFGLDKIFNPPPRERILKFDNSPIIVIYDENIELTFANEAYVKVTGLNSLDQIKHLAKDRKLYEEIYDDETLSMVNSKVDSIISTGGYVDQCFPMKKTGRLIKWNTLKHPSHNGSIRIGIDVTDFYQQKEIMSSAFDSGYKDVKFNFSDLFIRYKIKLKEILEGIPNIKKIYSEVPNISELNGYCTDLAKLALIGDMIADRGPYLISASDGNETFMNPRYLKTTGYSHAEISELIKEGKLINALYGFAGEEEYVTSRLNGLQMNGHYNDIFTLRRADSMFVDTEWDSFCFDQPGTSFRIGKIISPNYHPVPSYTTRDVIRLFGR